MGLPSGGETGADAPEAEERPRVAREQASIFQRFSAERAPRRSRRHRRIVFLFMMRHLRVQDAADPRREENRAAGVSCPADARRKTVRNTDRTTPLGSSPASLIIESRFGASDPPKKKRSVRLAADVGAGSPAAAPPKLALPRLRNVARRDSPSILSTFYSFVGDASSLPFALHPV